MAKILRFPTERSAARSLTPLSKEKRQVALLRVLVMALVLISFLVTVASITFLVGFAAPFVFEYIRNMQFDVNRGDFYFLIAIVWFLAITIRDRRRRKRREEQTIQIPIRGRSDDPPPAA